MSKEVIKHKFINQVDFLLSLYHSRHKIYRCINFTYYDYNIICPMHIIVNKSGITYKHIDLLLDNLSIALLPDMWYQNL